MPFSGVIDSKVEIPSKTQRAISNILADQGSYDQLLHSSGVIKLPCETCDAVINERCRAAVYPSGRVRTFLQGTPGFHEARIAAYAEKLRSDASLAEARARLLASIAGGDADSPLPGAEADAEWDLDAASADNDDDEE